MWHTNMSSQALQQMLSPLVCSGDPYARGLTQGTELKRQIALCFNAFFQSDVFQLLRPRWLPQSLATRLAALQARRRFTPSLQRHYPDYLAQMRGIAAGSEQPYDQFHFACAAEILLAEVNFHLGACSALAIPPGFATNEEPMLVKNFDYPFFLKSFNLVRQTTPEKGLRSLELTLSPLAGCHTGLNEAGVAITYNYGYGRDKPEHWIPITLRVQEALRTCHSAEEAVRFFMSGQQAGSAILTVIDESGTMSLVEISSGVVHSRPITNNLLAATNHYQITPMLERDIPVNAYYSTKGNVPELAGRRVRESSEARFDRISLLAGTKVHFHESDLLGYMRDHNRTEGNDNTLCRHGEYYETTCSVLIKPASRELHVAMGNPCQEPYHVFSLR